MESDKVKELIKKFEARLLELKEYNKKYDELVGLSDEDFYSAGQINGEANVLKQIVEYLEQLEEDKKIEEFQMELLRLEVSKTRLELYKRLSKETSPFGSELLFDKEWLKKNILGLDNEKIFSI